MRHSIPAAVTALLLTSSICAALSPDDVTFYAPLAGSPRPKVARGNPQPNITGKLVFVDDGVRGGLLTGGPNSELGFETAGNMNLDACTIAMWAKPVGWSKDTTLRFFMRVEEAADTGGPDGGNFLWFYKYFTYPVWLLVQQNYQQREVFLVGPSSGDTAGVHPFQWRDGRWDHLAASWHLNEMRVYVNGHYCGTARTETPRLLRKLGKYFYIGGSNAAKRADLVLSEFFVFDRPLTEAEIARLAAKGEAALAGRAVRPTLEAGCDFFPSSDRLRIRVSVVGRRPDKPGHLRVALTIERRATGRPVTPAPRVVKLEGTRWTTNLDTQRFAPGGYRVLATLLDGSEVTSQASVDFEKPKRPVWLGNTLGVPKRVPQPWTPVQKRGDSLSCWGRTYAWSRTLLPSQIVTQGQPLLARPIELVARVDGKTVRLPPTVPRWKKTGPLKAVLEGSAALGPLTVTVNTWMEFDGFVWTELQVAAPRSTRVERLSLEIPYRKDVATLWHANLTPGHKSGKVRPVRLRINGNPYSWIGNETGGLQWCTDRPAAWPSGQSDRMVEIEPGADEVVFRANFVDGARYWVEPLRVAFGLQATPVRPYPKGWRKLAPLNCWWPQWNIQNKGQRSGPCGYPVPSPDGSWRRSLRALLERGKDKGPFPYLALNKFWRGAPVYGTFRSEWVLGNSAPPPLDTTADPWAGAGVCPAAKSFVDWRIWRIYKSFQDNPDLAAAVRGMYLDVTAAPACGNLAHGCGLRSEDGTLIKRYAILGAREFQKRLYVLLQTHWPHMLLVNHESGNLHMSQLAFAHIVVDGESTFRKPPLTLEKMNYYDLLRLEDWRAEYMGVNYGLVPVFLPQPARRVHGNKKLWAYVMGPTGIPASEHVAGMLLVHDIIPWPAYMNPLPFVRVRAMKTAFGWDDATAFTGYWSRHDLVELEADRKPVVTSVYRRPGRALIVVMNDSDRPAAVRLTLNLAALGLGKVRQLVDAYAAPTVEYPQVDIKRYLAGKGEKRITVTSPGRVVTIPLTGRVATFTVKPRNFRALLAR